MKNSILLLILACVFLHANAQKWVESQILTSENISRDDGFAGKVFVYNDFALVSSEFDDFNENGEEYQLAAGSVALYKKNNKGIWTKIQKIVCSQRDSFRNFGELLYMHKGTLIIAANKRNKIGVSPGKLFVFKSENGIWEEVQQIEYPKSIKAFRYPNSIVFNNKYLVLKDSKDSYNSQQIEIDSMHHAGALFVYVKDVHEKWIYHQKIVPEQRNKEMHFGKHFSLNEDYIFANSNYDKFENKDNKKGCVFVYKVNKDGEWVNVQILKAKSTKPHDGFGSSIAISGKYAIIGSSGQHFSGYPNNTEVSGQAFIFEKNNVGFWSKKISIRGPQDTLNMFGRNVYIDSNYAIVLSNINKAGKDSRFEYNNGNIHVYKRTISNKWVKEKEFNSNGEYDSKYFAQNISFSNKTIIVASSKRYNDYGNNELISGAAYIFDLKYKSNLKKRNSSPYTMYPNPATNKLMFNGKKVIQKIEIYSLLGAKVTSFLVNRTQAQLDISNISNGTYLVKIIGIDKEIWAEPLIINKGE